MNLTCPQCGTVYDVSDYPEGHEFQCSCGNTLSVGPKGPIGANPASPGSPPPPYGGSAPGSDPGLDTPIKILLFFLNLCFTPIVGLVWWLIVRQDKPRTAKDVCTFTWIPAVIAIVLWGLYFLFVIGLAMSGGM